ncbi:MAG: DNA gyrase inhibitor YacG [Alphaproteobacteria bacterium]|nr:DNA gyrase inhibitor YacG [Alphaproteobacteria bacterium]
MADKSIENPDPSTRPAGVRVSAARCVHCGQPVQPRFRPFCSQRCADVDLGLWLRGSYRVATDEEPDQGTEPPPVDNSKRPA